MSNIPQTNQTLAGQLASWKAKPITPPLASVAGQRSNGSPAPPIHQRPGIKRVRGEEEPDRQLWRTSSRDQLNVDIKLLSGELFTGIVREFGMYNVKLTLADASEIVVFKNAIAWAKRGRA
jgi:sRNA-binding regulator protein Hfq